MGLLLAAVDVAGPLEWRWALSDEESRRLVAEHHVALDPASDDLPRFRDLYWYARSYSAPDRRVADGTRIIAEAGAWAGNALLGEAVAAAIAAAAPVTVQVAVPEALDPVLLWPLELAHVGGRPLAARGDVSFVYDIDAAGGMSTGANIDAAGDIGGMDGQRACGVHGRKAEIGAALQVLAVFSQPAKTSVLALRRERYALSRLIRRIAARDRAAVELRVAQYGVTRERLAEIADSGEGWDVLHLSGHGAGGLFLLEKADGSPDRVSTADLVDLLRPARRRVKLAVISACESAVDTTAQTLRLIGLDEQADALEAAEADAEARRPGQVPGLARALVRELGCAVVAMRYPVTDEFAIEFSDVLYERVLSRRQSVDVAVARAVVKAAGPAPSAARPAVSLATVGVFGMRAEGLTLTVPRELPRLDPAAQRMAYFPDEPERFVGRLDAMAEAGAALAPASGRTAVLLHGMAGGGKTACALELAYRHSDSFSAVAFWQAPAREDMWEGALADFANRLEIQLGDRGFSIAGHIGTMAKLEAFLPRLRRLMKDQGMLLVLDNLETLLTTEGSWRDPRWEPLITTLTGHDGESRVILTSRIVPAGLGRTDGVPELDTPGGSRLEPGSAPVITLPVHALSLEESAALARELPNLRGLLHADPGPVRAVAGIDVDADRGRVFRVLRLMQGHPKLLELADAAATDRKKLDSQLAVAEAAAEGQRFEAFFRDGSSALDPHEFLGALSTWTVTALGLLPSATRLMAKFIACLEENDRRSHVIEMNWADLWRRLGGTGDAPSSGPLLAALARTALAEPTTLPATGTKGEPGPVLYRVHPGVAAAIAADAGPEMREATDAELAAFWWAVADQVRQGERGDGEDGSWLVAQAGLAAAPYLLRRGDWNMASFLLDQVLLRDGAPGTVQAVLPSLRKVTAATGTPEAIGVLARALMRPDPGEAERLLRGAVNAAVSAGDYRVASSIAGELVTLLMDAWRLEEALDLAREKAEYTSKAALGPWSQLSDLARRVQLLGLMGEHARALTEVEELRAALMGLPDRRAENETAVPWNVRETILDTGHTSALATGDWQQCLDLNAEILASQEKRGAGIHEVTRTRFNDAAPLIRLGRLGEARRLLAECQQVYEDHADTTMLAKVLTTRADLEDALGHRQAAADLERAALRLSYARPDPEDIAISHHNLAGYLGRLGVDHAGQRAHQLAAALIRWLAGMSHDLANTVRALAADLREDDVTSRRGVAASLPSTVAEVVETAELTESVRLGALLASLEPDPTVIEDALARIVRVARSQKEPDRESRLHMFRDKRFAPSHKNDATEG
jgi:tetratricopeptide (TPR) repeat protein